MATVDRKALAGVGFFVLEVGWLGSCFLGKVGGSKGLAEVGVVVAVVRCCRIADRVGSAVVVGTAPAWESSRGRPRWLRGIHPHS